VQFGTWNVRSGSLIALARELDLLLIQEVRWDNGGTVRARDCHFFYGKEKKFINWQQDCLYHRIVLAVKRGEFLVTRCHIYFCEF
jgi:hypothetical protein